MTTRSIEELLAQTWKSAGFSGRGRRWHYRGPEVHWYLELSADWLGKLHLIADASLALSGSATTRNDDHPLRVFAENVPSLTNEDLLAALAPTSPMDDERRSEVLRECAGALAEFIRGHVTLESLRKAYAAGDLESAAMRKDLRELLQRGL